MTAVFIQRSFARMSSFLGRRVNIGSMISFRIMFGLLMAVETLRYVLLGWVDRFYSPKYMHFSFLGLDAVSALGGYGMHAMFVVAAFAALGIAFGWHYRGSCILFLTSFGYLFLLDKSNYVNHFYLALLLALMLSFMPANAAYSFDAKRKPIIASDTAPMWCLWLLRFQFAVIFLYSGISRLDLNWLEGRAPTPGWLIQVIETLRPHLDLGHPEELVATFTILTLIDFLIFFGLIWQKTRIYTVTLICITYLTKAYFFDLGTAPWLMIAASLLFLRPDWPHFYRRLWPAYDERLLPKILRQEKRGRKFFAVMGMCLYVGIQLIIPIRHLSYPAELDWRMESSRFSWGERARAAEVSIEIYARSEQNPERVLVDLRKYLTQHQIRTMNTWPDLVRDFARMLARDLRRNGEDNIQVFAVVMRKEKGGEWQALSDPNCNLLESTRWYARRSPWYKQKSFY